MLNYLKAMNYPDAPMLTHSVSTVSSVVNLASGTMTLEHRDMTLGDGAFALAVGHVYKKDWAKGYESQVSQSAGRNWKLNLEQYVFTATQNETELDGLPVKYIYIDPLGSRHNILEYGETVKTYSDASGLGLVLTFAGGKKVLTDALGNTLTFDASGRLETVTRRTGYASTTSYHTETTSCTYAGNRLTRVANRRHSVDISYDPAGNISSLSGDGGAIEILPAYLLGETASISQKVGSATETMAAFHYDSDWNLISAYPKSPTFLSFTYDQYFIKVTEAAIDAQGAPKVKRSDKAVFEEPLMTAVTDDMGVTLCYYFDKRGNTSSILERNIRGANIHYSSIAPVKGGDGGLRIINYGNEDLPSFNGGNFVESTVGKEIDIPKTSLDALKDYTDRDMKVLFSAWVNCDNYTGANLSLKLEKRDQTTSTMHSVELVIDTKRPGWQYCQSVVPMRNMKAVASKLYLTGDAGRVMLADVRLSKLPVPQAVFENASGGRAVINRITKLKYSLNGKAYAVPIGGSTVLTQQDVESTQRDKCVSYQERGAGVYRVSYDNGKRVIPNAYDVSYFAGSMEYKIRDNTESSQFFYARTSDASDRRIDKEFILYGTDVNNFYGAKHLKCAQMDEVKSEQHAYYDLLGRATVAKDEYGVYKLYAYDVYGNLLSSKLYKSPLTIIYSKTYSSSGEYPASSADARFPESGPRTNYSYDDPFGVLSEVRDTDSATRTVYDAFRSKTAYVTHRDASGNVLGENRLRYDTKNRLTGAAAGTELAFGYDIFGNLTSVDTVARNSGANAGATAFCGTERAGGKAVLTRLASFAETKLDLQFVTEARYGDEAVKRKTYADRYRRPLRVTEERNPYDAAPALENTLTDFRGKTTASALAKLRSSVDFSSGYKYDYIYDENDMLAYYEVRTTDTDRFVQKIAADGDYKSDYSEKAYRYTAAMDSAQANRGQSYLLSFDPNVLIEPRLQKVTYTQIYGDQDTIAVEYEYDALGRIAEERRTVMPISAYRQSIHEKKAYTYLEAKTTGGVGGGAGYTTPYVKTVEMSRKKANDAQFTLVDYNEYTYDNNGRITKVTNGKTSTTTFTERQYAYDALDRITRFDGENAGGIAYDYDAYGNISTARLYAKDGATALSTDIFDYRGDRLLRANDRYFAYNAAGYPTHYGVSSSALSGTANMSWKLGKLTAYKGITFKYDALGRLIQQTGADGLVKRFYYDGAKLLWEEWSDKRSWRYIYDASGIVGYHFYNGFNGYNQLITFDKYPDGSIKNAVYDGIIAESYRYDPFGNCILVKKVDVGNPVLNPIRWKGLRLDELTGFYTIGGGLYDPSLMRMVTPKSPDALLASAGTAYGLNRYVINLNSPMNLDELSGTLFPSMEMIPIDKVGWWQKNAWWVLLVAVAVCIVLSFFTAGASALLAGKSLLCALASAGTAAATTFTMAMVGAVAGFVSGAISGFLTATIHGGGILEILESTINGAYDGAAVGFMTGAIMGLFMATAGMTPKFCFIAGTLVKTRDGDKKIEDVKVDDEVLSYDEETGKSDWKKVVRLFRNESNSTSTILYKDINGELDELISTPGHKYYLPNNIGNRDPNERHEHAGYSELSDKWVSAKDLKAGDKLLFANGKYGIVVSVKTEKLDEPITVYNFEVEDSHTYHVGKFGVCTHNADCGTPDLYRGGNDMALKPGEYTIKDGLVQPGGTKGLSVNVNASEVARFGVPHKLGAIPNSLTVIQQGLNPAHFVIQPSYAMSLSQFQSLLNKIPLKP